MKKIIILLVSVLLLSGCTPVNQHPRPTLTPLPPPSNHGGSSQNQNEIDSETFSAITPLADENFITEVHYFEHDISYSINKCWLMDALKHSQEIKRPSEVMALEFELTFTFASNKKITLRYLDDNNHIFSISQDEQSYTMQSEEICIWLDYLNDVFLEGYSTRGTVTEIDADNNMFLLTSVEQDEIYRIALSDTCNIKYKHINVGDNLICLFSSIILPVVNEEFEPDTYYTADYIIHDTYEQVPDSIHSGSIENRIEVLNNTGTWDEVSDQEANIIIMVSNQSYDEPNVDLKGSISGLPIFIDTFECVTQHEFYPYYFRADAGVYQVRIAGNGAVREIYIEVEDEGQIWIAFTYWNNGETKRIEYHKQDSPIMIQ